MQQTAFVTRQQDALTYTLPGSVLKFLCAGDDRMPDFWINILEPGDGPPLHRHPWASWNLVLRGQVRFRHGGETVELSKGDFLYTPPDLPHTFMAVGEQDAELLGMEFPGGFHNMYAELAEMLAGGDAGRAQADVAELAALGARHDVTILGPPLAAAEAQQELAGR